jgi:hypothetical protein
MVLSFSYIILAQKVEAQTVLFRIIDGKQFGPKLGPQGGRQLAFKDGELDPLPMANTGFGNAAQTTLTDLRWRP